MKITIQRSTLLERVAQVIKAIPGKAMVPILDGILIQSDAALTLTCSDTHFTIQTTLEDYEEHEAGAAVIPAKKLHELLGKMPDKPILIEVDGANATVKCGSTKVKLPAMSAEEFPRKTFPDNDFVTINGADFARLVDGTKFAVSTNEQTPVLQGVLMEQQSGTVTATATDRHRLAKQSITWSGGADDSGRYIVPVRPLDTVSKLKPKSVAIGFSDSEVYLRAGDYQYISSLHDGNYPDTSKIIPTAPKVTVKVDAKRLLQTLELVEKVVEDKNKIVRFEVSDGELFISASDGSTGVEEVIEAEVIGDEMKLSANAKYLIDGLKCIEAERVEIWLTGAMSPVIFRAEGDESGLHLVLPYRTQAG